VADKGLFFKAEFFMNETMLNDEPDEEPPDLVVDLELGFLDYDFIFCAIKINYYFKGAIQLKYTNTRSAQYII